MKRYLSTLALTAALASGLGCAASDSPDAADTVRTTAASELVADYLELYFTTFPSQATEAGRHEFDHRFESLDEAARSAWLEFNHETAERAEHLVDAATTTFDERLDLELLLRQARRVVLEYEVQDLPRTSALFWSGKLSNATVQLLVRDDAPLAERLAAAAERARQLPHMAAEARQALASGDPSKIAPELVAMAARQVRASAAYYREGFARAAGDRADLAGDFSTAGASAADALDGFAEFLTDLETRSTGSPRLGKDIYERRFRVVTGVGEPVESVLESAVAALSAKRAETAAYGREQWTDIFPGQAQPADDVELVRRLFDRVSADRARDVDTFVEHYRQLIAASTEFVRERDIVTLPEPLTLLTDRSPAFFVGQSVGGVYPAGPYASPDAPTLLFLPTPSDAATDEQRDGFFRDFNEHFNTMITPHEIIPGHYLQLKWAARHPHKIRALFGDGVYIEGWGTFSERLMLDLGWGGPLDRLAHLKKQLENIARTMVDIRVHTEDMSRDQVLRFVKEEALQDEQFAANMWRRAITSAPQLTYYHLGYLQVHGLYEDVYLARGDEFELKEFMDGMMAMGPVPVRHYRERMLGGRG